MNTCSEIIQEAFNRHERAVIQFSGGKDSLCLLDMCKGYANRCEVHWVNTGASFPHVPLWIAEVCDYYGYDLQELQPHVKQPLFSYNIGFPSDIVPTDALPSNRLLNHSDSCKYPLPIQPWSSCCSQMIWTPLMHGAMKNEATLILRGQKKSDDRWFVGDGLELEGKEFLFPLADMNDADIFDYLDLSSDVRVPDHYSYGCKEGLDCWMCTAFFDENKMRYMKSRYPELHNRLEDIFVKLNDSVQYCLEKYHRHIVNYIEMENGL